MKNIRKGKGFSWCEAAHGFEGTERTARGFTVDNLDTKDFSSALNKYEKVFIIVRDILQTLPHETALQVSQDIADAMRERGNLQ